MEARCKNYHSPHIITKFTTNDPTKPSPGDDSSFSSSVSSIFPVLWRIDPLSHPWSVSKKKSLEYPGVSSPLCYLFFQQKAIMQLCSQLSCLPLTVLSPPATLRANWATSASLSHFYQFILKASAPPIKIVSRVHSWVKNIQISG